MARAIMPAPSDLTGQLPGTAVDPAATGAELKAIVATLLAAQAQLDDLGENLAAARLDAVIEAINVSVLSTRPA